MLVYLKKDVSNCCALLKRVCKDNRFARGEFKLEEGKGKREELAYLHPHV